MSELLLGIDVGTFSSKAALVTAAGEVLRTAVVPHGIATPAPGHVEQDADGIWWHDVCVLCRQLLDGAPYRGGDVAAVAVSAIGPCLLPLDAAGRCGARSSTAWTFAAAKKSRSSMRWWVARRSCASR